ncbi:serine/threonine-protein kinase pim-1-like [Paramormyrops kingsleyae]|uniref:serine/threonine-protein kinase pim-1-like n=1 Tax=Paramormyrops kingsleyae TaxID=1676925 RepID=UPI003B973C75
MEAAALDDAGHSTLSPKSTTSNSKERLEDFFSRGALIGSGGFGSVFAGIRKDDGLPVAIKEVRREEKEEVDIEQLRMSPWADFCRISMPSTAPWLSEKCLVAATALLLQALCFYIEFTFHNCHQ